MNKQKKIILNWSSFFDLYTFVYFALFLGMRSKSAKNLTGSQNIEGSCIFANHLFTDPSQDLRQPFRKPFVLLPLQDVNHFILFVLDLNDRTISYLDPMEEQIKYFKK